MRIIVVEDEIRIREGIISLLTRMDNSHEIVGVAADGLEGARIAEELKPELIITDIKLPKMDGLEMLETLSGKKLAFKAIIISAFSEFDYARKAIGLGVSEYLVKPISLEAFTGAVNGVMKELEKSRQLEPAGPNRLNSLENIFAGLMSGTLAPGVDIDDFLENNYSITAESCLSAFYLYSSENDKQRRAEEYIESKLRKRKIGLCSISLPEKEGRIFILHGGDGGTIKEMLTGELIPALNRINGDNSIFAFGRIGSCGNLNSFYAELCETLEWGILKSAGELLEVGFQKEFKTDDIVYPAELESAARILICNKDGRAFEANLGQAFAFFTSGNHSPGDIRRNMIRYTTSLYNLISDIAAGSSAGIEYSRILERLSHAPTNQELKEAFLLLLNYLAEDANSGQHSLPVKRVEAIIHGQYMNGISLFEIADRLNLTPGYLGSLFHKETGMSFNNCLKQHRIQNAMKLLIRTDQKLTEISRAVGFCDAKYFSRVFREVTGMRPGEFRRINR